MQRVTLQNYSIFCSLYYISLTKSPLQLDFSLTWTKPKKSVKRSLKNDKTVHQYNSNSLSRKTRTKIIAAWNYRRTKFSQATRVELVLFAAATSRIRRRDGMIVGVQQNDGLKKGKFELNKKGKIRAIWISQ